MNGKKSLLAALALLLAVLAAALLVSFDAPGLGRQVEERFRAATGVPLAVSRARLNLLRGLLLEDVRAEAASHDLRIPRVALQHRLLSLLRGRWEPTGIRLDETRIGAVSIDSLDLRLSRFDYDAKAVAPLHGIGASGALGVTRILFKTWELRDLSASVEAEGGRFRFEPLRAATGRGHVAGDLFLDFNSLPFRYRGALLGPSFAVGGLGPGTLRLKVEGFGTLVRNLKGSGTFELERGRLPDASWIREIDSSLAGAEHERVEIPFEVRDERVYIARVPIEAAGRVLAIEGSFGLDGSRDLRAY